MSPYLLLLSHRPILLFLLLLAIGFTVSARPVEHHSPRLRKRGYESKQTPFVGFKTRYSEAPAHRGSGGYRDAAANSVGVLFTTAAQGGDPEEGEEEVQHVWLPLGKRVYTRDVPTLPLRPVTARITTMIRSTPQLASPEVLERVVCEVYPRYNRTDAGEDGEIVAFSKSDGLVRLDDVENGRGRKEVEGYECSWKRRDCCAEDAEDLEHGL